MQSHSRFGKTTTNQMGAYLPVSREKGFSLIELLIVVAIILIIAAIAIPNLLRARMAANEASSVSSIRTINTAEVSYQSAYPSTGYSATLKALGPGGNTCSAATAANACLIDYTLSLAISSGTAKSGYYFTYTAATGNTGYVVDGEPAKLNQTGVRAFCSTEDGVIHANPTASGAVTTSAACGAWSALQ